MAAKGPDLGVKGTRTPPFMGPYRLWGASGGSGGSCRGRLTILMGVLSRFCAAKFVLNCSGARDAQLNEGSKDWGQEATTSKIKKDFKIILEVTGLVNRDED